MRKIDCPGSTRFGLRFSDASWLGPVRFGSYARPVPPGSRIQRCGSFRFGRFGSVSYSFLNEGGGHAHEQQREQDMYI